MIKKTTYWMDLMFLGILVIFLTWQPFYLHGKLNLFELGLYLPGIDAILHGQIPFRDFFYLRGPFELYVPAFLMHLLGEQIWVLETYFYVGTVLTLLACVCIGKELIGHRGILYMFALVLVTKTFPRVVFTFWGGLRYAWGILAVLFVVWFLKKGQRRWAFMAGICSSIGLLTSVEIGMSVIAAVFLGCGIVFCVQNQRSYMARLITFFVLGNVVIALPYLVYLLGQGALMPFLDVLRVLATSMQKTFLQTEKVPQNAVEIIQAMVNPLDKNFRQMTPLWGYLIFAGYCVRRILNKTLDWRDQAVLFVGLYGLLLYAGSFRNLWASQFEMALQPWKVLQFFLLWRLYQWSVKKDGCFISARIMGIILLAAIVATSLGYAVGRLNKRFYSFKYAANILQGKSNAKLMPLTPEGSRELTLDRVSGVRIPIDQADDLEMVHEFLSKNTAINEEVLMYPEMGAMHFIGDRPSIGRFPTATLAWLSNEWYHEWTAALKVKEPRYAIVLKEIPEYFLKAYFPVQANQDKYYETMGYIHANYAVIGQTPLYYICERKNIL